MPGLQLMDTTIRDGQQSLWATRMSLGDMLPILPKMDKVGYWAVEAWGGATFDTRTRGSVCVPSRRICPTPIWPCCRAARTW